MRRSMVPVSLFFLVLIAELVAPSVAAGRPNGNGGGWPAKFAYRSGAAGPQVAGPSGNDAPHGIEGTWRATGSFDSGGSDIALFTFGAGKDGEGVVAHSDNLFLVAVPSCLTSQGVWKKAGDKNFIATDEAFCFDSTNGFAPAGTIRFRTAVTVSDKWTQFSGRLHIDAFDNDGNLVFSDDATVQGTRMQVIAPPGP
jgi:hypothetical protein